MSPTNISLNPQIDILTVDSAACVWSKVINNSFGPSIPSYLLWSFDIKDVDRFEVKKNLQVPVGSIKLDFQTLSVSSINHGCQLSNSQWINTGAMILNFSHIKLILPDFKKSSA